MSRIIFEFDETVRSEIVATIPPVGIIHGKDVMALFNVTKNTLTKRIKEGSIPKPLKTKDELHPEWKAEDIWKAYERWGK